MSNIYCLEGERENVTGKENEKLANLLENSITSVFSEVRKDFFFKFIIIFKNELFLHRRMPLLRNWFK